MKGKLSALRKGRFSENGQIYHVIFRVKGSHLSWQERQIISRIISSKRALKDSELLSFVVMPDHTHLLIQLSDEKLGELVARLKSNSSRFVNDTRNERTSLWTKGYYDRAIRKDEDLPAVARYIVANPLRAGLVKSVKDYPYWNAVWL